MCVLQYTVSVFLENTIKCTPEKPLKNMEFGQNKNLKVKILKSYIWYKLTQNLMQINSFHAFFKLLWGKFSLSICVAAVKIVNYHPTILLTCDRVSSRSGQLFVDDCSFLFWCSNLFFTSPKSLILTNSPKFAFFLLFKKTTCVCYLSSFTVFASQTPFWLQNVSNRLEWNKGYIFFYLFYSPEGESLNFKIGGKMVYLFLSAIWPY